MSSRRFAKKITVPRRPSESLLVFLDSNVLISGTIAGGNPGAILDAWRALRFRLATTNSLLTEVTRTLARAKISEKYNLSEYYIQEFIVSIRERSLDLPSDGSSSTAFTVRDLQDTHVLAAALAGNVDYLVTGDADLLVLDGTLPDGAPRIVTPAWFVREVLGD